MNSGLWSDELSVRAPAIAARMTAPALSINAHDAAAAGLTDGSVAECEIGGSRVQRMIVIDNDVPDGVVGIANGYPDEAPLRLPDFGTLRRIRSHAE